MTILERLSVTTLNDKIEIANSASLFIEHLSSSNLESQANLIFLIAEAAKEQEPREIFSSTLIISSIANLLELAILENDSLHDNLKIQCMRAIANLCFDCDDNRDLVFESSIIKNLISILYSENLNVKITCCGCLLNTTTNNGFLI